jgi:hypothetical protein
MKQVLEVIFLPGLILVLIAYAKLTEWGLRWLRWQELTGDNCRRYLVRKGWKCLGWNGDTAIMDKGDLRVFIRTMEQDPATMLTLQAEIESMPPPDRLCIILVPGEIERGAVEKMREREISVVNFKRLADFDRVVREEMGHIATMRAYKLRITTQPLFAS